MLLLLAALALFAAAGFAASAGLRTVRYREEFPSVEGNVNIVFLSDVHCRSFGKNQQRLLALVEAAGPDLIAVTGDLISRGSTDAQVEKACDFLTALTQIAPTYFSIGNHENDYIAEHGDGVLERFRETGAVVLECSYEDLEIHGTRFRLGGMSELAYYGGDGKYDPKAEPFLMDYCATDLPKVMLSHRPEAFCFKYACEDWDVDLILSGHTHGGLIRLPFIGGVIAPIQGFFPDVYYGRYRFYDSTMIVTSGLAGYEGIPRMFNPPEICVVTLCAKG